MYFMRQLYKTYLSWASEQINREELRNQKCIVGTKRKKKDKFDTRNKSSV